MPSQTTTADDTPARDATLSDEQLSALEEMSATVAVKGPMLREMIRGYRLGAALRAALATVARDHDLVITPVADSYTVMIDAPDGPDRYSTNDTTVALSDLLAPGSAGRETA